MIAPRLRLAAAAFALALALAAYPLLSGGATAPSLAILSILGGPGLVVYAVALAGIWPGGLSGAIGLLAAEYLASLYLRGVHLDVAAPAYGAALFVCAELGWLAAERREGGSAWLARWFAIAGLALAAAALGWAALIAATAPLAGGLAVTALGVVAALAAAAGLAWLARSAEREPAAARRRSG
jgi:hypothetical protein